LGTFLTTVFYLSLTVSPLPKCVVEHSTLNHIAIVKDVVEAHYKNRALTDEHMLKYTEEEWLATETR